MSEKHHVIKQKALDIFGNDLSCLGFDVADLRSTKTPTNIAELSKSAHKGYSAAHRGYSQGVINALDTILNSKTTTPAQQKAAVTAVMGALKDALLSGHPDLNLATPAPAQRQSAAAKAARANLEARAPTTAARQCDTDLAPAPRITPCLRPRPSVSPRA
jgi:hypothetical protein